MLVLSHPLGIAGDLIVGPRKPASVAEDGRAVNLPTVSATLQPTGIVARAIEPAPENNGGGHGSAHMTPSPTSVDPAGSTFPVRLAELEFLQLARRRAREDGAQLHGRGALEMGQARAAEGHQLSLGDL
jgi:hypothetical protein